ncbi:cupin domain-containing protein [Nonomuraea sp. NPDC049714]|uniref:cupin domain-containing protein n=1 Tax=Nonomuraea sp. NPDC049714 TaxID=3364357 RepID=UPI0037A43896
MTRLLPPAQAYGVTLDELVDAPHTGDPRIHMRPVQRYGLTFMPLTRNAGGIQAYKVIHPPAAGLTPNPRGHEGYEWFYVMTGHVLLVLGDRELRLGPGEAAEFDTRLPHWIGNTADRAAELLMLIGAQGDAPTSRLPLKLLK